MSDAGLTASTNDALDDAQTLLFYATGCAECSEDDHDLNAHLRLSCDVARNFLMLPDLAAPASHLSI